MDRAQHHHLIVVGLADDHDLRRLERYERHRRGVHSRCPANQVPCIAA